MSRYIIDTNVPIVANNKNQKNSDQQIIKAIDFLLETKKNHTVLLDSLNEIFNEYKTHLSFSGQPGTGDIFFKWVFQNIGNASRVNLIEINYNAEQDSYTPYPDNLTNFDRSDRKFVSVSLADNNNCEIVNSADGDWEKCSLELQQNGIRVKELI